MLGGPSTRCWVVFLNPAIESVKLGGWRGTVGTTRFHSPGDDRVRSSLTSDPDAWMWLNRGPLGGRGLPCPVMCPDRSGHPRTISVGWTLGGLRGAGGPADPARHMGLLSEFRSQGPYLSGLWGGNRQVTKPVE